MKWLDLYASIEALPNIVEKNQSQRNTESPRKIGGEESVKIEIFTFGIGWHQIDVDKLFYDVKTDTVIIRSKAPYETNEKHENNAKTA
jgi:hypothetical protein